MGTGFESGADALSDVVFMVSAASPLGDSFGRRRPQLGEIT